ncbi:magnesium/cobalt transporter CorA [Methanolobus sp. WCC1]|uniref:magnesium/cobalt transporter CorA n=1 Tax=unclassified Methanolobus TaxID=2629569 RepID=UPI0024AA9F3C|nr:magnesium/cobalt transporter CorA [Methanolobus sp.]MDI3487156.1 magnesium transporter [Methanolobus sp.]MDK2826411.1 magnesium transporter [Methanolobus sp.]MDK2830517.1 magnesium transporter [Methanolobus sp.]
MKKLFYKTSKKAGLAPGSLIHIGEERTEKPRISIIDYDKENYQERVVENVEECFPFKDHPTVTWINIDGIHQVDIIEKLGQHFGLHPLVMEDIVHTTQRPKMEDYDSYIYIVLKMLWIGDGEETDVKAEQVSIILGENFVLSFQELEGDTFNFVRERIRNSKGRIRQMGSDYLAYALLDSIVDNYFIIIEKFGEIIEDLEEELVDNPEPETLQNIHNLKKEMIYLRKSVWPLREVINGLDRSESDLIKDSTFVFLKDVYDHTIQVADAIETYRDILSGILDVYLSSVSNKMNEVMKTLTIIATIFIPLTFLAGMYGMNFSYMPELGWKWGYPAVWVINILIFISMYAYFRRKNWL